MIDIKCPCVKCEKQGCGSYHDVCKNYTEWIKERKEERKDIKKKYEFTRSKKKTHKGSRTFEKQKNLGY